MLVINDPSSLSQVNDPAVRDLIRRRIDEYGSDANLATFVVVEPGDPLGALDAQLGFPILTNRFDGSRYGEPGFAPSFEVAEDHGRFFEMVFVLADYGDGVWSSSRRATASTAGCFPSAPSTPFRRSTESPQHDLPLSPTSPPPGGFVISGGPPMQQKQLQDLVGRLNVGDR